jgi:hypothetical protein
MRGANRLKAESDEFRRAVDAASPYLQCGGSHAHLLRLGDSILCDGIPKLCAEIDRLKAEAERRERDEAEVFAKGYRRGFWDASRVYAATTPFQSEVDEAWEDYQRERLTKRKD